MRNYHVIQTFDVFSSWPFLRLDATDFSGGQRVEDKHRYYGWLRGITSLKSISNLLITETTRQNSLFLANPALTVLPLISVAHPFTPLPTMILYDQKLWQHKAKIFSGMVCHYYSTLTQRFTHTPINRCDYARQHWCNKPRWTMEG